MKYIASLILVLFFLPTSFGQTTPQIQTAKISFAFVDKDVEGSISGFNSASKINWNEPEKSTITGSVATETLKTGNFLRDWSLQGSKYFDADAYPRITFKSTKVVTTTDGFLVDGEITIKNISKSIQIKFKKNENRLQGTTTLFSSDFDITIIKKGRDSNKVIVNFDLGLK